MLKTWLGRYSLIGTLIRLSCLCGGWWVISGGYDLYLLSQKGPILSPDGDMRGFVITAGVQGLMQTLFMTAALWCTAQVFDNLKVRKPVGETLLRALFRVGLFTILAKLPAFYNAGFLEHGGPLVFFDFIGFATIAVALCLILMSWQTRRLRTELDQIV